MANYIELVGVPGVGKSTTYDFLRTKLVENENWILYEELCGSEPNRGGVKNAIKSYIKKIVKPNGSPPVIPEVKRDRNVFNRFVKNNPELIELFWQGIQKDKNVYGRDLRFHAVEYIIQILEKIQQVTEKASNKYCIVDEGLIHNINYFVALQISDPIYKQQVSKVLDAMTLPVGVVYFGGDIDTIMGRTLSRSNFIQRPRDEYLSSQELMKSRAVALKEKQMYIEAVKSRNVPVLSLECNESVSSKSQKIMSFINRLA